MHQIKSDQLRKATASDDDTEIVIVSDTVRQRRSRTPITPTDSNRESNLVMMPDLLPKKVKDDSGAQISTVSNQIKTQFREKSGQKQQLVEVKERDLITNNVGNVINTVSILESCNKLEPQHVEMVNIIDVTSDSDTATSTPIMTRKSPPHNSSIDELTTELKRELDTLTDAFEAPAKTIKILSESETLDKISMMKLRPSLKDLLMEERGSFYSADKENFDDEPLVFSDDEEIPRYSIEMDSDSDLVDRKIRIRFCLLLLTLFLFLISKDYIYYL